MSQHKVFLRRAWATGDLVPFQDSGHQPKLDLCNSLPKRLLSELLTEQIQPWARVPQQNRASLLLKVLCQSLFFGKGFRLHSLPASATSRESDAVSIVPPPHNPMMLKGLDFPL